MRWSLAVSGALAVVLGPGCGDPSAATEVDVAADTDEPDRTQGMPLVEEIVIPMRPLGGGELHSVPVIEDGVDGPYVVFDSSLTLAYGDGYPRRFTASLPEAWWGPCGMAQAPIELQEITAAPDVASVELLGDALHIVAQTPGRLAIRGRGTAVFEADACGHTAGTVLPVDFSLSVAVRTANAAVIEHPCDDEPILVAPAARDSTTGWRSWFRVQLTDDEGPYYAQNAAADAQVTVRLHGAFEAGHASPQSLEQWLTQPNPGIVEMVPELGEPIEVEVVDASRVTGAEISYHLAAAAGGGVAIVDGGSYGPGWGRTANRLGPVVNRLEVGDDTLCSAPDHRWFELTSSTPEVCEIIDRDDFGALPGDDIGRVAHLLTDGTCRLQLRGPGPVAETLEATFVNIEGLHDSW